jgi:hypothetical protein
MVKSLQPARIEGKSRAIDKKKKYNPYFFTNRLFSEI